MDINSNSMFDKYRQNFLNIQADDFIKEQQESKKVTDKEIKLKQAVKDFSAIFINQMFKSMRNTLSEENFIDAGFAEDVFTEMLDAEISKLGANQHNFTTLNETLYQQLKEQGKL